MKFSTTVGLAAALGASAILGGVDARPAAAEQAVAPNAIGLPAFWRHYYGGVPAGQEWHFRMDTPPDLGAGLFVATLRGYGCSNLNLMVRDCYGRWVGFGFSPTDKEQVKFRLPVGTNGCMFYVVNPGNYPDLYNLEVTFTPDPPITGLTATSSS